MHLKKLTATLSVTAQISAVDVSTLATQGFRGIINNRPDGECEGQPTSAALQAAALKAGMAYRHIPVVPGQLQDAQVHAFATALEEMPGPLLAFCRTGTRSTTLWAINAARILPLEDVLHRAAGAGCDLSALRPRLQLGGSI
jgi:uncharacterized protein (TIGR01244 family)